MPILQLGSKVFLLFLHRSRELSAIRQVISFCANVLAGLLITPLLVYQHMTFVLGILLGKPVKWTSPSRNPNDGVMSALARMSSSSPRPAMPVEPMDAEIDAAVAAWRAKHQLRADDPVLLVTGVFHIYQHHSLRLQPWGISSSSPGVGAKTAPDGISRSAAAIGLLLAALGGFAVGRGWP